ncbi:MAG: LuxR family transcriptional regulator [Solirubrobacterales bacterium]|nr:LuxR family transcriptional regulator [Solirubrobacterales bacterium]
MTELLGNLPEAVTSFVGRRRELAGARQRMSESRLVTLVGAGGVGKTRLATQVASDARKAFRDGVWMVDLASLADETRLAQTVLSALDVRDQSARDAEEQLQDHVARRQLLIVLDNCEHLLEGCAHLVDRLLRHSPGLRVLATSREALGIDGEHLFPVPTLSSPSTDQDLPLEALAQYEAVTLLVDRARGVRPDFQVTPTNQAAVVRLCHRLDGIPLAIELAAVRLRALSVDDVVARLDHRFDFLTGGSRAALPRQQTLRALIDWSHELCTPEEQLLWARLSVFPGSFDLSAAEAICSCQSLSTVQVVDLLDHLVSKSILLAEPHKERPRYRMLVTLREYGASKLAETGERGTLDRRHRDHFHARARAMVLDWCGPGQEALLDAMRQDHPNLRAALEWSMSTPGEARTGARFAASLRWHWVVGGFLGEGGRWLDQALEQVDESAPERGEALWVAAWIELLQGQREQAAERLQAARTIADSLGDEGLGAHVSQWTGILELFGGQVEASIPDFERAVAAHAVAGHNSGGLFSLFQLGVARAYAGELARASRTVEEGMRRSDHYGERWARAYTLWTAGIVAWRAGDIGASERAAREALLIQRDFEDGICSALILELLAWCSAGRGEHTTGARLLGAARAVWSAIGTQVAAFGPMYEDSAACEHRISGALGPDRFAALVGETASLSVADAIAFGSDSRPRPRPTDSSSPLSPREDEVAGLVAKGLSNRAIAETLVLSPRTIDGHIERIFAKLGFSSRAQVAAWVAEHDAGRTRAPESV